MFDKIKKAMEKQPKKSKEQKDYEENQHNQKSEMQATFRECVNRMRDMGWQMQPVWRHINDTIPNIAAAEIMLMPISFDQHQQIEEVLEKQKAGKKRMRQFGKVEIPQSAFIAALRMSDE